MADEYDPLAEFDATTAVAEPEDKLASIRSGYAEELKNPKTVGKLYALTQNEVGGQGEEARQAFMETTFNRAAARGQTLDEAISDRNYYPAKSLRPVRIADEDVEEYQQLATNALQGSNTANYATGNASGTVGFNKGPQTLKAGGERFGIEGPDVPWAAETSDGTAPKGPSTIPGDPLAPFAPNGRAEVSTDPLDAFKPPPMIAAPEMPEAPMPGIPETPDGAVVDIPDFLKAPEDEEEAAAPAARHRIAVGGGAQEIPAAFLPKKPYELTPISQDAASQEQFVGTPIGPMIPVAQGVEPPAQNVQAPRSDELMAQVPPVMGSNDVLGIPATAPTGFSPPTPMQQSLMNVGQNVASGVMGVVGSPQVRNFATATGELGREMAPHDLPSYAKSVFGPAAMAYDQIQAFLQGDTSSIPIAGRIPELIAAEKTPAFSKERYKTAEKVLMDLGMLAPGGMGLKQFKNKSQAIRGLQRERQKAIQFEHAVRERQMAAPEQALPAVPEVPPHLVATKPNPHVQITADDMQLTSTKNQVVDAERQQRGLDPIAHEMWTSDKVTFTQVEKMLQENPRAGRELASAIVRKEKTTISRQDEALLMRDRVGIQNERAKAASDSVDAKLTERERGIARENYDILEGDLNMNDTAAEMTGRIWTEWGNFRQRLVAQDYSLASLEKRLRSAKDQAPITAEESIKLKQNVERYDTANRKLTRVREKRRAAKTVQKVEDLIMAMNDRIQRAIERKKGQIKLEKRKPGRDVPFDVETEALLTELHKIESMAVEGKLAAHEARRLEARKAGLEREIARRKGLEERPKPQTKLEPDLELEGLQVELASLKALEKEAKAALKPDPKIAKMRARNERLERAVAQRKGLEPKRQKGPGLEEDIESEALRSEIKRLDAIAREKNAIPAAIERANKQKAILEQQMQEIGGTHKKTKRENNPLDKDLLRAQYELSKVKEEIDFQILKARLEQREWTRKLGDGIMNTISLSRSLRASCDLSALRRQGGVYMMAHPIKALKTLGPTLRAGATEKGYIDHLNRIRNDDMYPEAKHGGLSFTDVNSKSFSQQEELFRAGWGDKVPLVKHSNRAYSAMLNEMRMDWYKIMRKTLVGDPGKPITAEQSKAIAYAVNSFTGRGNFGEMINSSRGLSVVFFAPRYKLSRFQTIIGQPLWRGGASGARKAIAKEYARALIGYGVTFSLINFGLKAATGQGLELNPISGRFAKIKIGNTDIDLLSGLAQPTTLMARLITGYTKTLQGKIVPVRSTPEKKVEYGKKTGRDLLNQMANSALAPVPAALVNAASGETVFGEPVTIYTTIRDLTVPMFGVDTFEAIQEHGVAEGSALGLMAFFGDSVNTWSPRVVKKGDGSMLMVPSPNIPNINVPNINVP